MPDFSTLLTERASAVAELHRSVEQSGWGSIDLKEAVKAGDALKQAASEFQARAAARVALESRAELGHKGFAQREGFKSAEGLLQFLTGVGYQEANRQIENGKMLAEAETANELGAAPGGDTGGGDEAGGGDGAGGPGAGGPGASADPTQLPPRVIPWRELVGDALRANLISVDAADVIRRVLSEITGVDQQALTAAAQALMDASPGLSREQLFRRARQLRDVIDAEHIPDREQKQRDNRFVKLWIDDQGMHRGIWCLPPEDGVHVAAAFRQIMSPRRPTPKFRTTDTGAVIDTDAQSGSSSEGGSGDDDACTDLDTTDDHGSADANGSVPASEVPVDDRTWDQRAADGFMDIFRLAGNKDTGTVFGSRTPCVRVIITAERFIDGTGPGHI
ncbi:DUF222 domain-containing protein, partial [Marisediminicola senii]|uniref:DUF222 domain-containing protein n=1 Tax=Marisediminicola senii TaxID=2711233 RepID=UPI0013EA8495